MTDQLHTMNVKHSIEIPGLPEGWRAVAYRQPLIGEWYLSRMNKIRVAPYDLDESYIIIEKIQPRRIVLEETDDDNDKYENVRSFTNQVFFGGKLILENQQKIWRVVEDKK